MICRGRNYFATAWQKDRILASSTMRCSLAHQQRFGGQISSRLSLRRDSIPFMRVAALAACLRPVIRGPGRSTSEFALPLL